MSPFLVVLDIDETLVHSRERPLNGCPELDRHVLTFSNSATIIYTYPRPGLAAFLRGLHKLPVRIAVWTAATRSYAIKILDRVFPDWRSSVDFLWTRTRCSRLPCGTLFKDLSTVPLRSHADSIVLVDDSAIHETMNSHVQGRHAVFRIRPFRPSPVTACGDRQLARALRYIEACVLQRGRFTAPSSPASSAAGTSRDARPSGHRLKDAPLGSAAVAERRCRFSSIGFVVDSPTAAELADAETNLTITPLALGDFGPRPRPFRIYARTTHGSLVLPRFYGAQRYLGIGMSSPIRAEARIGVPVLLSDGQPLRDSLRLSDIFVLDPRKRQVEAAAALSQALDGVGTPCADMRQASVFIAGGGILSLAVGMGKTVVAIYVAMTIVRKKTLVVVHTATLMSQWRDRFQRFVPGVRVGIIQGSNVEVADADVVVAMLQSLAMHAEYPDTIFKDFGFVIFDEVHLVPTHTFSRALRRVGGCRRIIGLSATPVRKDGLSGVLRHFIGEIVFAAERERTMRVTVRMINSGVGTDGRIVERRARHGRRGVDHVGMITDIVADPRRNELVARECVALRHMRVLVLTERRAHAEVLRHTLIDTFSVRPEDIGLYIGGMPESELSISAACEIILGTYSIASVGLDIPGLNALVLATPRSDVVQASGRILRDNNPSKVIIDIVDRYSGAFVSQMRKRLRFYRQMGYTIESGFAGDFSTAPRIRRANTTDASGDCHASAHAGEATEEEEEENEAPAEEGRPQKRGRRCTLHGASLFQTVVMIHDDE